MKPFAFSIAVEQERLHLSGIRLSILFPNIFGYTRILLYNKLYKVQFRATYDSFKEGKRASASLQYPAFLGTNITWLRFLMQLKG
jgi:hypothetical protein